MHRSCPLQQMIKLIKISEHEFYALNIDLRKDERELLEQLKIHVLEHNLASYAKTAAYIEQMI